MRKLLRDFVFAIVVTCISPLSASTHGIQQTPFSAPNAVMGGRSWTTAELAALSPLVVPGTSGVTQSGDSISTSGGVFQGVLPKIANLQVGFIYTFGSILRGNSASVDYLLPLELGSDSIVYGEAHAEFPNFSIDRAEWPKDSVELCLGGGYRKMLGRDAMIGLHSFFDETKLSGKWYASGSLGVEMAAQVSGHDAIDVNVNWYGQPFDASFLGNGLDYYSNQEDGFGHSNFDFQAGYSHELNDPRQSRGSFNFWTPVVVLTGMQVRAKRREKVRTLWYQTRRYLRGEARWRAATRSAACRHTVSS